jgi:hypothetical protein
MPCFAETEEKSLEIPMRSEGTLNIQNNLEKVPDSRTYYYFLVSVHIIELQ